MQKAEWPSKELIRESRPLRRSVGYYCTKRRVLVSIIANRQSKDPFDRPSPGLIKRLAAEARNDAKRRVFQDEAGPSDHERRQIMLAKARKYEAMRRGDYSGLTEKEIAEGVLDVGDTPLVMVDDPVRSLGRRERHRRVCCGSRGIGRGECGPRVQR